VANLLVVMERLPRFDRSYPGVAIPGRLTGMAPHLECRTCGMPILLQCVERDGPRRGVTCPYCEHRDEWEIADR
jgi:hypothetical protein